jgi:enoyl-CoA hydratase/carnithine racemase
MTDCVRLTIVDGVADVRLNRPDKLNGLDLAMFDALVETGKRVAEDRTLRAVVLSGEGRGFCAGLDFMSFMASSDGPKRSLFERSAESPANLAQRAAFIWAEVPIPVIAAVHGVAFGGGIQIALAADIRIVAPDARLSVMEIKWGLIPDMSGTQTLRRLIPLDVAKELTFTGKIVSGIDAVELGLATRLSETPYEDAMALAREIAGKSPDAVRAGKRLLNAAGLLTLAEGLQLEEDLQRTLMGSPNQMEAVQANFEKRAPRFRDPQ